MADYDKPEKGNDKQKPPTKAQPIPQRKRLAMPDKQPKPK